MHLSRRTLSPHQECAERVMIVPHVSASVWKMWQRRKGALRFRRTRTNDPRKMIMSKVRSDSTWSGVAAEKLEMLDRWLFEDNLCYREAKERIKAEWDMEVSIASRGRYYRDREQEVALGDAADLQETADAVEGAPAKLDKLRSSAWKMIGVRLLERTLRRGDVKELAMLGRLMSESEWREIQRGRLELAREKFGSSTRPRRRWNRCRS